MQIKSRHLARNQPKKSNYLGTVLFVIFGAVIVLNLLVLDQGLSYDSAAVAYASYYAKLKSVDNFLSDKPREGPWRSDHAFKGGEAKILPTEPKEVTDISATAEDLKPVEEIKEEAAHIGANKELLQNEPLVAEDTSPIEEPKDVVAETPAKVEKAVEPESQKKDAETPANVEKALEPNSQEKDSSSLFLKRPPKKGEIEPYAILHVGPMKTGTTTIQHGLHRFETRLLKDRVMAFNRTKTWHIGVAFRKKHSHGVEHDCPEWKDFMAFMDEAKAKEMSVVISHEGYWNVEMAKEYKKVLADYRIIVIVGYRRWFEWLPSMYSQNHKRKLLHDKVIKEGVEKLVPFLKKYQGDVHETENRRRVFRGLFDDIRIMNMYNVGGNLLRHFMCDILIGAYWTCKRITDEDRTSNLKVYMHYGHIAEKALQTSMVDYSKHKYKELVKLVEEHNEKKLGRKIQDLPLACPSKTELTQLLNISLTWEKELVPEWASSGSVEAEHREKFKKASKFALCDVDAEAVLQQQEWITFFKELGEPAPEIKAE